MDSLTAIQRAMDFYYEITGLRSYFVQGVNDVDSAKEKNFFCKTLKMSSKALDHCEACTLENYTNALNNHEIQMYSCHAGLVKWSIPVEFPGVTGSKALDHCEACTLENYTNALNNHEIQMYSCHAGLVKWSIPVEFPGVTGVIVSEGVISSQQVADKDNWIDYLVEKYNLPRNILMENYEHVVEMTEKEVDDSVKLLVALLDYYRSLSVE